MPAIVVGDLPGLSVSIRREGVSHLLFERAGKVLQVEIKGECAVSEPVRLVMAAAVEPERLRPAMAVFEAFGRLCAGQDWPRGFEGPAPSGARLRQMLSAMDGWQEGLSQRQIGIELFGAARVCEEWGEGSDHLKSQIRRLVRRGRWLMEGGYRGLLR